MVARPSSSVTCASVCVAFVNNTITVCHAYQINSWPRNRHTREWPTTDVRQDKRLNCVCPERLMAMCCVAQLDDPDTHWMRRVCVIGATFLLDTVLRLWQLNAQSKQIRFIYLYGRARCATLIFWASANSAVFLRPRQTSTMFHFVSCHVRDEAHSLRIFTVEGLDWRILVCNANGSHNHPDIA